MKKLIVYLAFLLSLMTLMCVSCSGTKDDPKPEPEKSKTIVNLERAIKLTDSAIANYVKGTEMTMSRYYNPYTKVGSSETASVWMYTAAIEAVNSVLDALKAQKDNGITGLYEIHNDRYLKLLSTLYDNVEFYKGTYTLTSYTQTKEWSVYGVNRGRAKGSAIVEGIENVYDDQEWLVRELIESYKVTGDKKYLQQAEYLTAYILDGWDCTLNDKKVQHGGITWGPGYITKHSCSNGPIISPLVWLSDIYKNSGEEIEYLYIANDRKRVSAKALKSQYYLDYAKAVYEWQKSHLLRPDKVYDDMMGGASGDVPYETVYNVRYRKHVDLPKREGPAHSYNSGTMLSGASDLYRATGSQIYLDDLKTLSQSSFGYFAKFGETREGYYTYSISGFANWFNCVLMRGYVSCYDHYSGVAPCVESFQDNLDYGYDNHLYDGMLPVNLLVGWNLARENNKVEALTTFAFAAEYAVLAKYELEKDN